MSQSTTEIEMITTTLKALRKNDACVSGYNKIACHVTGNEYNSERETYVRHRHDDPIPIGVILDNNGLDDALWALRACEQTPEMVRAERLFAVWCARQVQHLMPDARPGTQPGPQPGPQPGTQPGTLNPKCSAPFSAVTRSTLTP